MRTYLAAALIAALAPPATAVTFPTLTTIYVGSGVVDDGGGVAAGIATVIHCSNVSGVSVQIRFLILSATGAIESALTVGLDHGDSAPAVTHPTFVFDNFNNLATGFVNPGVINVESTNSGDFCTAMIVDAAAQKPSGIPIHLVRVNPHPGTVE